MAYIDLTNVEVATELSENAHLLVEDGGKIVRSAVDGSGTIGVDELMINYDTNVLTYNGEEYVLENGTQVINKELYEKINLRNLCFTQVIKNNVCISKGLSMIYTNVINQHHTIWGSTAEDVYISAY